MMVAVFALMFAANSYAQDQQMRPRRSGDEANAAGWMEKMKANRVAFLTNELDLTAEEAQVFWPVYNQAQEEKDAAFKKTRQAYRAMMTALKEGKSDKEVSALLKAYLDAAKVPTELDAEYAPEYLKVLPATKVAKLYASEEKFRKLQFQNFQGPGRGQGMREGQGGPQGFRDGQGRPQGQGFRDGNREGQPRRFNRGGQPDQNAAESGQKTL